LHKYLDSFCTIYLNNILIYNNILKKCIKYIKKVLIKLKKAKFYLNINKYKFSIIKIKYLSLIIIIENIKIDFVKIEVILK